MKGNDTRPNENDRFTINQSKPLGPVPHVHHVNDLTAFMRELAKLDTADIFHIINLELLSERLHLWRKHLPSIRPFYAIKTNHDQAIVAELAALGLGFDCASVREVAQVFALGVAPERIIFANPFKSIRTIKYLREHGVKRIVFDSADELTKLVATFPEAELVLRIATDDTHSVIPLSAKFGASLSESWQLLDLAAKSNANVVGVSFHVGSNCNHAPTYRKAILEAAHVLDYGRKALNLPMTLLDLGGGWPGAQDDAFVAIAATVRQAILETISPDIRLIAEPGSFFASQSTTAMLRCIGRRSRADAGGQHQHLHLASGIYGLFFCGHYLKHKPAPIAQYGWQFAPLFAPDDPTPMPTTLWGPTCDAIDKIIEGIPMPRLAADAWIYSHNLGSYSQVLENDFNQIDRSLPIYVRYQRKNLSK